ncbi:hypothetical protein AgCh_033517 [Apium graveolens]
MTPAFFQKQWAILGRDIVSLVKDFFVQGRMPSNLNETNVVLIPKKRSPTKMGDLRPISLCNVMAKIITKVLANRMKEASEEEVGRVLSMLQVFGNASSQKVNRAKLSVFFSYNTSSECRARVCETLQMVEADERSMYLGLPNTMGRNKSVILGFLKDKVNKRVASWDGKLISKGGKEVVIKLVAQTLPSYAMSVFLLPIEITKDIEKSMARYWWCSQPNKEKGIHWMSWDRMSHHKTARGMGFRNLRDFNLALLGKQGWRFLIKPESLVSRMFKARYFPSTDFPDSALGSNPSFVWRSVWESKDLVKAGPRNGVEEDKLFWNLEESGNYSVKSAYRLLQVQKGLWRTEYNDNLWKRIWRIKAPPKVLNLVWRALSGCLLLENGRAIL